MVECVYALLLLCVSPSFFCAGLQHQGIFRVSGSQLEVNDIKNSFERGLLNYINGTLSLGSLNGSLNDFVVIKTRCLLQLGTVIKDLLLTSSLVL